MDDTHTHKQTRMKQFITSKKTKRKILTFSVYTVLVNYELLPKKFQPEKSLIAVYNISRCTFIPFIDKTTQLDDVKNKPRSGK